MDEEIEGARGEDNGDGDEGGDGKEDGVPEVTNGVDGLTVEEREKVDSG